MGIKYEDYYKTLGIKRIASHEEIRRAYRKLAQKYHPDVNKNPQAAQRLARINEAYEVLKDPDKRKRFDALGANWKSGQNFRPPPGWENLQYEFGGQGRQATGGFSFQPGGQFSDFFEVLFSQNGRFEDLLGQRTSGRSTGAQPPPQESTAQISISLEESFHGCSRRIEVQGPQGTKIVEVKIPPGTVGGSKIRLRGEHLILLVQIQPHSRFQIDGRNLQTDLKITAAEAALGATVDLLVLDGTVSLSIPVGSQSGSRLRLRQKGLGGHGSKRGDLVVQLLIAVPKDLSDKQRTLYEQLDQDKEFNPRD